MGGGGLLGGITGALFGSPATPATPDYTGAAQATAAGNLDAARAATAANRVNQVTPYGSLNYAVTGQDPYGNPTWTATTQFSPDQQALYNYDIASSKGLGALQEKGLNYVRQMIEQPFSTSSLPQLSSQLNAPTLQTTLGDQGMEGWDKATGLVMQRLAPQMERQQKALDTKLANQGIMPGSEAYKNAKTDLAQAQNDQLTSAIVGGFNTGLAANQQQFAQEAAKYQLPLQQLTAFRQATAPNYVAPSQQQTVSGPDYLTSYNLQQQNEIARQAAEQAGQNAVTSGLFGLGSSLLGSKAGGNLIEKGIGAVGGLLGGLF